MATPQNMIGKLGPETLNDTLSKVQGMLTAGDGTTGIAAIPGQIQQQLPKAMEPAVQVTKEVTTGAGNLLGQVLGAGGINPTATGVNPTSPVGTIFDGLQSAVQNATGQTPPSPGRNPSDPAGTPTGTVVPTGKTTPAGAATPNQNTDGQGAAAQPAGSRGLPNPFEIIKPNGGNLNPFDVAENVMKIGTQGAKAGDQIGRQIFKLSSDDEKRWGKKLHEQTIAEAKVVNDPALKERLRKITVPLLKHLQRPEIDYTFTVLQSDSDDYNAFALPGGYIYLHSALVDFAQNDKELQTVLAHEIGHVDLRHCANKLAYCARVSDMTSPALGDVVSALHNIVSRPYARDEEFEADYYGFAATIAAGHTREEALAFPRRFGKEVENRKPPASSTPKRDGVFSAVMERTENHFNTHPPISERLRRLEAIDADAIRAKANARP